MNTTSYIDRVEIRAAGIPALAGITAYDYQPPFRGSPYLCACSDDYYGHDEIEWEILDRRGRPAPWLERKLSKADREEITREVLERAATARRAEREWGDL